MHRQALRAWLLFTPGLDQLRISFSTPGLGDWAYKVMAGGTPANPATLALGRWPYAEPNVRIRSVAYAVRKPNSRPHAKPVGVLSLRPTLNSSLTT
jgi:hypothetical protein